MISSVSGFIITIQHCIIILKSSYCSLAAIFSFVGHELRNHEVSNDTDKPANRTSVGGNGSWYTS